MFSTVRYFIKTSVFFLILGILTGVYLSIGRYLINVHYSQELISAHTHVILVGSVMMMIMGVALWFFPRAEKNDKRYNPDLILFTYYLMTISTFLRYIAQVISGFVYIEWLRFIIAGASLLQVISMILFFYSIWGRIRPLGSQFREAKGEKF